ncbi:MAG: hypothetical protein WCH34_16705 [Bacteroidota bacterium]
MNESKKIKIAKEIKFNCKIIIYSFIIGIISYPLLAFYDGGFKAITMRNSRMESGIAPTEASYSLFKEKLKVFSENVYILGDKNNTLQKRMAYENWNGFEHNSSDSIFKKISKQYLLFGTVYQVSMGGENPNIGVLYYDNYGTLTNTIEKIFGRFGILRSFWIFLVSSIIIISVRYLFIFTRKTIKWINRYSQ